LGAGHMWHHTRNKSGRKAVAFHAKNPNINPKRWTIPAFSRQKKIGNIFARIDEGSMFQKLAKALVIPFLILIWGCGSDNPVDQPSMGQYFTVDVVGEQFTMLVTDPATIQLALDNLDGKNQMHPTGRIMTGNGGFNNSWNWHFVPDTVRMAEVSVEVCDGLPSYVNAHITDFLTIGYCPWSGKIVKAGR
jgi:hypothetical protein